MTVLLCLACNNKTRQTEPIIYDDNPIVEQVEPDTVATTVQNEAPKVEEKPSGIMGSVLLITYQGK